MKNGKVTNIVFTTMSCGKKIAAVETVTSNAQFVKACKKYYGWQIDKVKTDKEHNELTSIVFSIVSRGKQIVIAETVLNHEQFAKVCKKYFGWRVERVEAA